MGYVVAIIIAILVVVFLFTVFPEFMWTLLATLVIVIIVALVQAKGKNPKENSSNQNTTPPSKKIVKEKPLSAKELQRQKELEKERAAEMEKQRLERCLQEEEPVFKPFAEASNIERRFALETWLNERLKAIISIKNEIAFEQELLAHLRRKKEAYVHYGLDTTWLDERIDSSINKLSSIQQELSGNTIYLCEYKTQTYLGSQNLLRDFIQGYTQINKEIYLNGIIEDAKWFDFNTTHFVAWMPFCVLLADKRTLNVRICLYSEVIVSENASATKGMKEKTYSLKIVCKSGETFSYEKALPASKQSKMEQYKRVIADKEKSEVVKRMLNCTETPTLDVILAEVAEQKKLEEQEKCREFLSKPEPTTKPKFKLTAANTNIAFGNVVCSVFQTYIDLLNDLDKSDKHLTYLKKRYDAEMCLGDESAFSSTQDKIKECEALIRTQQQKTLLPICAYKELTTTEAKEQNKYQKAFANIEREFSKAIKQITENGNPIEPFGKFLNGKPMLEFSEDTTLVFFPYFLVLLQKLKEKDSYSAKFLTYDDISFGSGHEVVRLKYGESLPKGAEMADAIWEHQRTDGSPDMRYRNNKVKYSYYVGTATFKVETFKKVFQYQTRQKAKDVVASIKKYQKMLQEGISKVMVDTIHQSKEIPALDTIAFDMFNLELQKKEEEKREKQRKLEEERAARKKAEEEQKAAQKKAEEERKQKLEALRLARLQREEEKRREEQEQRAREVRVQNELAQKDRDEKLILEQQAKQDSHTTLSYALTAEMLEQTVRDENVLPIDDAQKKTITNSIARRTFVQKANTPNCDKYLVYFSDKDGNRISEQRVLNQKDVDAITDVSFELKSSNGFSSKETYYLVMFDFVSGDLIGALQYKINIAFANDFDF